MRRFLVPIPSRDLVVSPGLLAGLVRCRRRFDVVHAHNYHALPALGAALAGMRPLIFSPHYHGGGHSRAARVAHLVYLPVSRLLLRSCDHIVCVSSAEATALGTDFPKLHAPVTVLPNGVVTNEFAAAEPFALTANVVVAAGRIEPYKQFDRLALAAQALPASYQIIFLGDGPARPALERLIEQRGLQSRARVLGRVSAQDLRRWFRTAKVLVSMSQHEAFGLTLIEALAAGTPVVASDIPAHREIAHSQPQGAVRLVAEDANPYALATAIVEATTTGLASPGRIPSWDDNVSRLLGIYESVIAENELV